MVTYLGPVFEFSVGIRLLAFLLSLHTGCLVQFFQFMLAHFLATPFFYTSHSRAPFRSLTCEID